MNIKEGMSVRVTGDLKETRSLWGTNDHMLKMRNTMRVVDSVVPRVSGKNGRYATCIYLRDDRGSKWSFAVKDLSIPEVTPPSKPVMFDPKNISTEV